MATTLNNQKIDAPPRSKECGLNGARFLDDRSVEHTLKGVVCVRHYRYQRLFVQSIWDGSPLFTTGWGAN